jgi:hypothetical protein
VPTWQLSARSRSCRTRRNRINPARAFLAGCRPLE